MMVDEFIRHLDALERTVGKGFKFEHVRDEHGEVVAIRGKRVGFREVDTYTVLGPEHAEAARYSMIEYGVPHGEPSWRVHGSVADVLKQLLALPTSRSRR